MGRLRAFTSWITTATVTLALAASIVVLDRVVGPPSHVSVAPSVTATTTAVTTRLRVSRAHTTAVNATSRLAENSVPSRVVALSDNPVTPSATTMVVTTTTVSATTTSTTTTTTSTTTTTTLSVVTTTTRPHHGDDGGGGSDDG